MIYGIRIELSLMSYPVVKVNWIGQSGLSSNSFCTAKLRFNSDFMKYLDVFNNIFF